MHENERFSKFGKMRLFQIEERATLLFPGSPLVTDHNPQKAQQVCLALQVFGGWKEVGNCTAHSTIFPIELIRSVIVE